MTRAVQEASDGDERSREELMTQPDTPALAGMSIGAVLDLLRLDFPDVTISKIRFLEAEGLVTPQRSGSGYRRFTAYDCARLRFILTAQRDHYLPLKVIKAQLDAQSDGALPANGSPYSVPRLVPAAGSRDVGAEDGAAGVAPTQVRLSREDLLDRSGVSEEMLAALCKAGIITTGPGTLRRAFGGHRAVRAGPRCIRRGAPTPAGIPLGRRPAVGPDRADRRPHRQSRESRRPRPRRRPGARGGGAGDHVAHLADQVRCTRRSGSLRTRLHMTVCSQQSRGRNSDAAAHLARRSESDG